MSIKPIVISEFSRNIPIGKVRSIAISAANIFNSYIYIENKYECILESKRRLDSAHTANTWKIIREESKKTLQLCSKHNLTTQNPYYVKDCLAYGIDRGKLIPIFIDI